MQRGIRCAVGSFAVQFAKIAGGFVYAVDKGVKRDYLTIGADVVINYTKIDFADVVKDIDLFSIS